jgi:hypothetical protein
MAALRTGVLPTRVRYTTKERLSCWWRTRRRCTPCSNLNLPLKHLAATKDEMPDDISPDDAWKRTLKVLLSPMGRLESVPPPDLADRRRTLRPHVTGSHTTFSFNGELTLTSAWQAIEKSRKR